jgi:hypothetical protein
MATKKTTTNAKTGRTSTKKAPVKKASAKKASAPKEKKEKKEPVKVGPRHPHGRVQATSQGSKAALAKALAPALARADEDTDQLEARLKTASNSQLLRLQRVADAVRAKYGNREGLIEAIGKSENKTKDQDFLTKLASLSLPNLLDLATIADRRARS